jgi:hypothetical protein
MTILHQIRFSLKSSNYNYMAKLIKKENLVMMIFIQAN